MSDDPVIIEVAINGTTTKEQNPHVPRTAQEIAADALACFDAGAAIVHNHVATIGKGLAGLGRCLPRELGAGLRAAAGRADLSDRRRRRRQDQLRPPAAARRVGPVADRHLRSRFGQPRRRRRAGARRGLRLLEQLRSHRRHARPPRRARPGPEPGDLRARVPAHHARLPARRAPAAGDDGEALLLHRARPVRRAVRPAPDGAGARCLPRDARRRRPAPAVVRVARRRRRRGERGRSAGGRARRPPPPRPRVLRRRAHADQRRARAGGRRPLRRRSAARSRRPPRPPRSSTSRGADEGALLHR